MEDKLELKHLAPYLPYGLDMIFTTSGGVRTLTGVFIELYELRFCFRSINRGQTIWKYKPILRPLSDLTKEMSEDVDSPKIIEELRKVSDGSGCEDEWIDHLWDFGHKAHEVDFNQAPYRLHQYLLSLHYDVFGLIDKGLAIDVNTLND